MKVPKFILVILVLFLAVTIFLSAERRSERDLNVKGKNLWQDCLVSVSTDGKLRIQPKNAAGKAFEIDLLSSGRKIDPEEIDEMKRKIARLEDEVKSLKEKCNPPGKQN